MDRPRYRDGDVRNVSCKRVLLDVHTPKSQAHGKSGALFAVRPRISEEDDRLRYMANSLFQEGLPVPWVSRPGK